jgi:CubicO group peptidase (beta-lactamase class C family)
MVRGLTPTDSSAALDLPAAATIPGESPDLDALCACVDRLDQLDQIEPIPECQGSGAKSARCRIARLAALSLCACAIALAGCRASAPAAPATRVATSAAVPASGQLFASSAATAPAARLPDYWPTAGWRTAPPETQGLDPARLAGLNAAIATSQLNVHSVLVVRNGYIVAETYAPPYTAETRHANFSVTKSFISTLVGIAIDRRLISGVRAPVVGLFPDHRLANASDRKSALTVEDLLTMRAGFDWVESRDAHGGFETSANWRDYMLDLSMIEQPGTRFDYCSGCSHLLSEVVQQTTGTPTLDFARRELFEPLGIADFGWETDPDGTACGGWGLRLTPRDMAKLGYLYLNEGRWDGRQVVSAEWVRQATERHVALDDGFGYGYQWWTDERLGAYFARGKSGQLVVVIPKEQTVVVVTSDTPSDLPLLKLIEEYVVPAVR